MDAGSIMQVVNLGGVLGFAFLVYRSVEKLSTKIEAMTVAMGALASRMDVASGLGRGDPTPRPFIVRPPTEVGS